MARTPRTARTPRPSAPMAPTAARAWNDEALYTLPSGKIARLRRPGVLAIASATNGNNPITDAVLVQHMTSGDAPTTDEERATNIRKNTAVFIAVARLCFVSPRVVDAPDYDADEIAPTDIDDMDLLFLYYTFVQGGALAVAPFRVG